MIRLLFPSLTNGRASVSYELGVAILLAWVGQIVHEIKDIQLRYPPNYWIWRFIDDLDLEKVIPWYALTASLLICLGLLRVACGCSRGHVLRATGLLMGASLFLFISVGHLSVTFYSVSGAPYLFLAWRFLELALFYVRRT